MLVKKYKSKIVSIQNQIRGLYTLELNPIGSKYKYNPGQFLHLAIDENYDGIGQWPESRCFSMQSNPEEETIIITYAVKGKFTRQMEQCLKIGSEVWLKLPYGNLFTQDHNKINTVFIAGGTGITPFLSLFSHPSFEKYINPRIYLGFRSSNYNIYQTELKLASKTSNSVELNISYEDENGILDISNIYNENGISPDYFLSGPAGMITGFKTFLINRNVPICKIRTDDWE
jgi:predicted ferric reductase